MSKIKNIGKVGDSGLLQYRNTKPHKKKYKEYTYGVREKDAFTEVHAYLPSNIHKVIKETAEREGLPMGRIVSMALYKLMVLDNKDPMIDLSIPKELPYRDGEWKDEALCVYRFMSKVEGGMSLDLLVLCSDQMGLTDIGVKLGVRELLKKHMIEEYYPQKSRFKYRPDYRYLRIVIDNDRSKMTFKKLEGENV